MSAATETVTRVTFRKFSDDGQILAVFPDSTERNGDLNSYMFVGQHGPCDANLDAYTVPATEAEYASMKRELEGIGYTLEIV